MSFASEPYVSLDENLDDVAYVQVTASTDTPEKAIKHLFESAEGRDLLELDDTGGLHPRPAYNNGYPEQAKVTSLNVSLPVAATNDAQIAVWPLIRSDQATAWWQIDTSEAVVSR